MFFRGAFLEGETWRLGVFAGRGDIFPCFFLLLLSALNKKTCFLNMVFVRVFGCFFFGGG